MNARAQRLARMRDELLDMAAELGRELLDDEEAAVAGWVAADAGSPGEALLWRRVETARGARKRLADDVAAAVRTGDALPRSETRRFLGVSG